jgi:antitoxin component of MazEF toxin-antitoxin module
MGATTKARHIGTSLGVIIPAYVAEHIGIKAGTLLDMDVIDKRIIIKLKYPNAKTQLDYINESLALIPIPDSEYY